MMLTLNGPFLSEIIQPINTLPDSTLSNININKVLTNE